MSKLDDYLANLVAKHEKKRPEKKPRERRVPRERFTVVDGVMCAICTGCKVAKPANNDFFYKNKDARKQIAYQCIDCCLARVHQYEKENPGSAAARQKIYRERHKDMIRVKAAKRKLVREDRVKDATPIWADHNDIESIYDMARAMSFETGLEYVVDHAIPIKGKKVSGLHVAANLQIMLKKENEQKYNKLDPSLL